MNIPREPQADTPIPADWGRDVVRCLRSLRSKPGPGITLNRTPEGTTISSKASGPGPGPGPEALARACPAMITGGSATAGYTITLYADGLTKGATGTGIFFTPEAASDSTVDLPEGTAVIAHPIDTIITGGT